MNTIPTPEKCIKMLEEKGCSKEVIRHCKAVRDIAVIIAKKTDADIELVEAGALLHDIGRSRTHGIFHAIEGVKIARNLGLSDKLVKIIERHIGAGISANVAKKLGLPSRDFIPQTLEEKIVCHADNLIDNCCRQNIECQIERVLIDGHKNYALRLVNLHNELSKISGMDLNNI